MVLYHKWGVKTGSTFALQFFLLISDGLGGVTSLVSVGKYKVSERRSRAEGKKLFIFADMSHYSSWFVGILLKYRDFIQKLCTLDFQIDVSFQINMGTFLKFVT